MSTIGILALQGDFEKHEQMISALGHASLRVRIPAQLTECDGLIIPGGESTTLIKLMKKHEMWDSVINFAAGHAVYGTCAGCILAARDVLGLDQDSLNLIDITVQRNAYGRQVDSFIDDIRIHLNGIRASIEGVFIRAPKIVSMGSGVMPLAWHGKDVVLAEQGHVLVGTFHPELTDDLRIHNYFIEKTQKKALL